MLQHWNDIWQVAVAMLVLVGGVCSYPDYVPASACMSMTPDHGVAAQSSQAPFTIELSHTSYTPGQKVTVTLKSNTGYYFEGVFIQARRQCAQGGNEAVGTFADYDSGMKTMQCSGTQHDALSHSTKAKKSTKKFSWIAPATATGPVYIKVTFVKKEETFWTEVKSTAMADATNSCPSPSAKATSTVSSITNAPPTGNGVDPISTETSRKDKGLFHGKNILGLDMTLFIIIVVVAVVAFVEIIIGVVHLTNYCRSKRSPPKNADIKPQV